MKKGFTQIYTVSFEFEAKASSKKEALEQAKSHLRLSALNCVTKSAAVLRNDPGFELGQHEMVAIGLKSLLKINTKSPLSRAHQSWLNDLLSEFTQEIVDDNSTLYQNTNGITPSKILWETPDGIFEFLPSSAIANLLADAKRQGILDHYGVTKWLKDNAKKIDCSLMLIYDFA